MSLLPIVESCLLDPDAFVLPNSVSKVRVHFVHVFSIVKAVIAIVRTPKVERLLVFLLMQHDDLNSN